MEDHTCQNTPHTHAIPHMWLRDGCVLEDVFGDWYTMHDLKGLCENGPLRKGISCEATDGQMIDCVIEAVGGNKTMELALSIVGIHGNVSVLGVNGTMNFRIPRTTFVNGVTITGNFLTEVGKHWQDLIPLLRCHRIKPEQFVTNRASLADGVSAYQQFDKREAGILKTMLTPEK